MKIRIVDLSKLFNRSAGRQLFLFYIYLVLPLEKCAKYQFIFFEHLRNVAISRFSKFIRKTARKY